MEKHVELSEQSTETEPTAASRHRLAIFSLMVASGFAGLGYEMVWTRAVTVALGHEIVSVLAVIAAFFAGLGIGAWFLDRPVRRSARPTRWYAAFEFVIALWSVFLIVAIDVFNMLVSHWLGVAPAPVQHWLIAFGATFVLLLPATVAMGGTLPALQRVLASVNNKGRGSVAGLYAANTFGAVLGTLVTTMYLVPSQGLDATLLLLAGVNLCCALAALVMSSNKIQSEPADDAGHAPTSARLGWLLAVTGFLGIGFEVIVIRVLSQVLENTVFTFASLLSVYLVGTAVGAAWFSRWRNTQTFEETLEKLVGSMAIAVLVGTGVLYFALPVHLTLTEWFGNGYVAAISGEMVLALLVFALPTLVMGALFSHLAEAARSSFGVGRALGVNTIAGALAPLMFGVFLLPLLEAKLLLLGTAVAYLLCVLPPKGYRRGWVSAPLLACLVAMVTAPALRVVRVPEGGELLSYTDGVMASVAVVADARGTRYLKVNDHFTMGSSASGYSDARQTHVPMLLHPNPNMALYLGLGTGSTMNASRSHPDLTVTGVELIPEVVPAMAFFENAALGGDAPEFEIVTSDARRFVQVADRRFDVIIGEVFHPSRDGSGALYTVEHFSAIRNRVAEGGLFCQWLPLFQLDIKTLKTIVRSFQAVFPDTTAVVGHFSLGQPIIGLIGRESPVLFQEGWIRNRVRNRGLAEALVEVELVRDLDLFGLVIADDEDLRNFSAGAPLNTDNLPVATYQSSGFVYADPEPAAVRLNELLSQVSDARGKRSGSGNGFGDRLDRYWRARDAYLSVGASVSPHPDPRRMLAQIRQPFLEILAMSPEFAPAYRPLVEIAYQLAQSDREAARALLDDVIAVAPDQPQALELRQILFPRSAEN